MKTAQKKKVAGGVKKASRTTTETTVPTPAARKKALAAKPPVASKTALRRADLGGPVEPFFEKQPAELRRILEALRKLVLEVAPDATASLKWGMPFYMLGGETMCALGAHKAHVNLILAGPPGTYADPDGRLEPEGKTGRHLKLHTLAELPVAAARGWIKTAAKRARSI